eukprot:scaffold1375_cov96-Isochrysis_galbana.AAC.9
MAGIADCGRCGAPRCPPSLSRRPVSSVSSGATAGGFKSARGSRVRSSADASASDTCRAACSMRSWSSARWLCISTSVAEMVSAASQRGDSNHDVSSGSCSNGSGKKTALFTSEISVSLCRSSEKASRPCCVGLRRSAADSAGGGWGRPSAAAAAAARLALSESAEKSSCWRPTCFRSWRQSTTASTSRVVVTRSASSR